MRNRPKLGEILVQAGIIDDMQLEAALGEQQRWGRRLGVTLVKMGMVEEGHLIRALAKQLDLPIATLSGKRIAEDVLALVPARVASEHGVVPLFVKREERGTARLYLGMEDPSDLEVLDDLAFRTGLEIHPVMVTPSEIGSAIDRYYHSRRERMPVEPGPASDEAIGWPSLRRVEGDPARHASRPLDLPPAPPSSPEPAVSREPSTEGGAPPGFVADRAMPPEPAEDRAGSPAQATDQVPPADPGLVREIVAASESEQIARDVARALDESERTRFVAKALTQLLIEKGLLDLEEVRERVARLKGVAAGGESPGA